jgi:hypothetical protein
MTATATLRIPNAGEQWRQDRGVVYTVYGTVRSAEPDGTAEVLYRSDGMPMFEYRRRCLESWHGQFQRVA